MADRTTLPVTYVDAKGRLQAYEYPLYRNLVTPAEWDAAVAQNEAIALAKREEREYDQASRFIKPDSDDPAENAQWEDAQQIIANASDNAKNWNIAKKGPPAVTNPDEDGYDPDAMDAFITAVTALKAALNGVPEPENRELDHVKDLATVEISSFADSIVNSMIEQYPENEQKSWPYKFSEAQRFLAGEVDEADTVLLKTEAAITGESVTDLANRIVVKAAVLSTVSATVAGMRRQATEQIQGAANEAQMKAIIEGLKVQAKAAFDAIVG